MKKSIEVKGERVKGPNSFSASPSPTLTPRATPHGTGQPPLAELTCREAPWLDVGIPSVFGVGAPPKELASSHYALPSRACGQTSPNFFIRLLNGDWSVK